MNGKGIMIPEGVYHGKGTNERKEVCHVMKRVRHGKGI